MVYTHAVLVPHWSQLTLLHCLCSGHHFVDFIYGRMYLSTTSTRLFNTIPISTRFIQWLTFNSSMYCYVMPTIQFRHTVKEFQVLLLNNNYSIQHYSIFCTRLNEYKYCYVSLKFQLNIRHLFIPINQFYF